jgi:hypothetical protein
MDDTHLLALGQAVYSFQKVDWLAIWMNTLVSERGEIDAFDQLTFGQLVRRLNDRLAADPSVGGAARLGLVRWAHSLHAVNTLRQDVFHSYPVQRDQVMRQRRNGEMIEIHLDRLGAAKARFELAVAEGAKLFDLLWPYAELGEPKFTTR